LDPLAACPTCAAEKARPHYIVFNGLAARGEVQSLTFLDVKTGGGVLTLRQR
jgi:predicted Holliday junction resolvase-like endonuclease